MEAVHECLHPDDAPANAVVDQFRGLGGSTGSRLLAQHMLAGVGRAHRPLGVQVIRQRDVDRIHLRVSQELRVGACAHIEPGLRHELGTTTRLGPDRREFHAVRARIAGITTLRAMFAAPRTPIAQGRHGESLRLGERTGPFRALASLRVFGLRSAEPERTKVGPGEDEPAPTELDDVLTQDLRGLCGRRGSSTADDRHRSLAESRRRAEFVREMGNALECDRLAIRQERGPRGRT